MERRHHFNEELNDLHQQILTMGALVEDALEKSILALSTRDAELAESVISGDKVIDDLQAAIEDQATQIIALEQPVASDLRQLVATTKLASGLERIGDHSRHIARAATSLPEEVIDIAIESIRNMGRLGVQMIRDALSAFVDHDPQKAREVADRDDQIDTIHKQLYAILVDAMKQNPEWIQYGVNLLFLNRFLERLGDHVTNMCEWVVFAKTGQHVELNK